MEEKVSRRTVVNSLSWKLLERFSSQIAQLVIQIILARLLFPKDYAVIAIVLAIVSILSIIIQGGYGAVIIQKKDLSDIDLSSVFCVSMLFSIVIYMVIFLLAPVVSEIFNNGVITNVLRALGLTLIFGVYGNILNSLAAKRFRFKAIFISALLSTLLSGAIGIWLAYSGYGVWALVVQNLVNQISAIIILALFIKWLPGLRISKSSLKYLFSHGTHLFLPSLFYSFYKNSFSLVIGKEYGNSALGYYDRGRSIPEYVLGNVNDSVQAVVLPTLATHQLDLERIKSITKKAIGAISFVMFPMCFGLAALSGNIIHVLLTDRWIEAVFYFQMIALFYVHIPISHTNQRALMSIGKTRRVMVLNFVEILVGVIVFAITYKFGPKVIIMGYVLTSIPNIILYMYFSGKVIGYSMFDQVKCVIRPFVASIIMCLSVLLVSSGRGLGVLILQLLLGAIVYVLVCFALNVHEIKDSLQIISRWKNNILSAKKH